MAARAFSATRRHRITLSEASFAHALSGASPRSVRRQTSETSSASRLRSCASAPTPASEHASHMLTSSERRRPSAPARAERAESSTAVQLRLRCSSVRPWLFASNARATPAPVSCLHHRTSSVASVRAHAESSKSPSSESSLAPALSLLSGSCASARTPLVSRVRHPETSTEVRRGKGLEARRWSVASVTRCARARLRLATFGKRATTRVARRGLRLEGLRLRVCASKRERHARHTRRLLASEPAGSCATKASNTSDGKSVMS
mmetsp:Transcript_20241/g.65888  ORF Transcript_20241/g.65888 Transcript_20241/m.65888 type:complete len:263 (-) Transcript_20241:102-890(-)